MEVSNEIKEDIRRTQSDLKNAIRVHQIWVARLQEEENNVMFKCKVKEAENHILAVSSVQKSVVERLRRELELYQRRLKLNNRRVDADNDNRYVAQQLRDYQIQHRARGRGSLLKPSVLTDIRRGENGDRKALSDGSDSESKLSDGKENGCSDGFVDKYSDMQIKERRTNFTNVLNKVKERISGARRDTEAYSWQDGSDAGSDLPPKSDSDTAPSPSPSPPPLPDSPYAVSQETFLRFLELVTPRQREAMEKKNSERRKRCTTSTNRNEFVYDDFDMPPKRKKLNQFPYLQTATPPQTRSRRLRRLKRAASREPSPPNNGCSRSGASDWITTTTPTEDAEDDKPCAGCGGSDVPSLLVRCSTCGVRLHTGCGAAGRCPGCRVPLPDPATNKSVSVQTYRDKILERARLQDRNRELTEDLRKLEARACNLKDSLATHNEEKRELLARQVHTQRHLQKLLDVMSRFKDTAVGSPSNTRSLSDSSSDRDKGSED